jgi:hypothetical protein
MRKAKVRILAGLFLVFFLSLLLSAVASSKIIGPTKSFKLFARLTGEQEVPPVDTEAIGFATFIYKSATGQIFFKLTCKDLSSAVTGIHLHDGDVGVDGGIRIPLPTEADGTCPKSGVVSLADGSPVQISIDEARLLTGGWYINVHTSNNSGGEIRGQLIRD